MIIALIFIFSTELTIIWLLTSIFYVLFKFSSSLFNSSKAFSISTNFPLTHSLASSLSNLLRLSISNLGTNWSLSSFGPRLYILLPSFLRVSMALGGCCTLRMSIESPWGFWKNYFCMLSQKCFFLLKISHKIIYEWGLFKNRIFGIVNYIRGIHIIIKTDHNFNFLNFVGAMTLILCPPV